MADQSIHYEDEEYITVAEAARRASMTYAGMSRRIEKALETWEKAGRPGIGYKTFGGSRTRYIALSDLNRLNEPMPYIPE